MIDLPEGVIEAMTGSRQGEQILLSAWLDGLCTVAELPVSSWKITDDSTRQVRRQFTADVSNEGDLIPLLVTDPLAPAGQRIAATYVLGDGTSCPLGEFKLTSAQPSASWRITRNTNGSKLVSTGVHVSLTADDLTHDVKAARLLAPESPPTGATAKSEIMRLLDGLLPVVIDSAITDVSVSTSTVWEQERMDAVDDLVAKLGAVARMGSDAALHVDPILTDPVWQVYGGDEGVMVSIDHQLSIDGLYNAAISTSSGTDTEITGVAYIQSGPLRWDGPLGHRPIFHSSPLITTQAMADKDAATYLSTTTASQAVTLSIVCLPHPGLQSGDHVTVGIPIDGRTDFLHVAGTVESLTLQGTAAGLLPMELSVIVAVEDLAQAVRYA
ncbi:hypothetical protein [Changpingibacter yushuensis]|uniref:hypothetical protein n=1 Tax=Changpingibacter yushuensis TaxID=2758440 RepID=UPI00165D904A|nr:hypothetical protein [Changpingibacter yushuensis]